MRMEEFEEKAVENFRAFLRIPTVPPDTDYSECVEFLRKQAISLNLPSRVVEVHPGKPVVIITWLGQDPKLPSIWLNCHMDVVPVFPEKWNYPPFEAQMDSQGNIYARGAQDMKCAGIQYLEAIRRLRHQGFTPKRTVYVGYVPDEEVGGILGMKLLVQTQEFRNLNVGFALDEGMITPDDSFLMFHGERITWKFDIHCNGNSGHGSLLVDNTACEKFTILMNRYSEFKKEQTRKVKEGVAVVQDIVTVNLTQIKGGVQENVIPDKLTAGFDARLPADCDFDEVEKMLQSWCKDAGEDVILEFSQKNPKILDTRLENNPFWEAFKGVFDKMGRKLEPVKCPATTDMRYIRQLGIPAFGFSPMCNTPNLIHDHNEFLNRDVFLNGIKIYMMLIPALSNV